MEERYESNLTHPELHTSIEGYFYKKAQIVDQLITPSANAKYYHYVSPEGNAATIRVTTSAHSGGSAIRVVAGDKESLDDVVETLKKEFPGLK